MATRKTKAPVATAEPLLGMVKIVPLDVVEMPRFLGAIGIEGASSLSPFSSLLGRTPAGRPADELCAPLGALAPDTMRHFIEPMVAPDRILDARATAYEGAPAPCRFYSSRRHGPGWAGLRPGIRRDYEVLAPYSDDDLHLWAQLSFELSAGNNLPVHQGELTGEELAFLLALLDTFKRQLHRSYTVPRTMPEPIRFRWSDIIESQNLALRTRDRRWLLTAVGEILEVLVHPGTAEGIGLPLVTAALAEREVRRYAQQGWLEVVQTGTDPLLQLSGALPVLASSLLAWLSMVSLHDIQVTGTDGGRPVASEEALLFVVGEPAIWALATSGLTEARADLASVTFGLRAVSAFEALEVFRRFLAPIPDLVLPDSLYEATTAVPPTTTATWAATHRVPDGGLPAWDAPGAADVAANLDPGLEVQVLGHQPNGWAQILCSNGWSAWVDGSRLEEVAR